MTILPVTQPNVSDSCKKVQPLQLHLRLTDLQTPPVFDISCGVSRKTEFMDLCATYAQIGFCMYVRAGKKLLNDGSKSLLFTKNYLRLTLTGHFFASIASISRTWAQIG